MSLRKYFFKNKFSYRIYLYYNLYIRHKCFIKKTQYSQWGEDLLINEYFKDKKNGAYLDVGCFHPVMYSNTYLLHKKGWHGINIDINETSVDLFNILRPNDFNFCTTIDYSQKDFKVYYDHPFSPVNTLDESYYNEFKSKFFKNVAFKTIKSQSFDEILKKTKIKDIDFLNIDVEGMDLRILKQLVPNKIKPDLISIETHNVDGSKSTNCDKINELLIDCNFQIYKRIGPSTLFNS